MGNGYKQHGRRIEQEETEGTEREKERRKAGAEGE
jgi:hypothetical protein